MENKMTGYASPVSMARPKKIEFGGGVAEKVGAYATANGFKRVFVVADAFNAGRVDLLKVKGEVIVFGDVKPEPDVPNLEQALAAAEHVQPDLVIGFGGGSAMDLAKLVSVLLGSGKKVSEIIGLENAPVRRCGLVQVPTTSGTGSEAGARALVTDPATQNKIAVDSSHMIADLAVIDPDLTLTVPPSVTAFTGVDAMAHCVEAYTNRKAHPLIDIYAIEGIRLVGKFLARAVADGSDREARAGLSAASLYGGFCLGPVNTAAGHAVAYPLGSRHHIAHGAANALIFPHVLAFNAPAVPEKTVAILQALNLDVGKEEDAVFEASYNFCQNLGIEMHMSKLGVPEDDLPRMVDEAFAIRRLLDNNPRELSREDILVIYRSSF